MDVQLQQLSCRGGVIRVVEVDAVPDEALVAEAGGMGAPTVGAEKLDAFECEAALRGHFRGGNVFLASHPEPVPHYTSFRSPNEAICYAAANSAATAFHGDMSQHGAFHGQTAEAG